ncbi:MAG TPA: ATP-binding protein [Gemmataceae bacterium]|jgi:hypothetical protein|nr:ATP-binding protein [Gemmataceae bacterium]
MAAKLILPDEVIDVNFVPVLYYGPPGLGKTQIAQTAENPITLDFDKGAHRLRLDRGPVMQFDTWTDVIQEGEKGAFKAYHTVVIDTGGRALDTIIPDVLAENPKNGYRGNLSPQGYGVLGGRFVTWMKTVKSWNKDVVVVCHQENDKDANGNPTACPDFPGKMALKEIYKTFDMIGQLRHNLGNEAKGRYLDFSPGEGRIAKNAPGFDPVPVPELENSPRFLAELIERAKLSIGKTAEKSAALAREIEQFAPTIAAVKKLDGLNAAYLAVKQAKPSQTAKRRLWTLMTQHAAAAGWAHDPKSDSFVEV